MVRMVNGVLGKELFREGLGLYMRRFAYRHSVKVRFVVVLIGTGAESKHRPLYGMPEGKWVTPNRDRLIDGRLD